MPEIDKVIRKGDTVVNIIEQSAGEYVTYNLVTLWVDGTVMTDAKCDGKWFRKHGSEYFKRVVDPNVPYKATISEIRTSIGVIPYLFKRIVTTDRWQEGEWELMPGSTASDNTGTILETDLGFRLRRIYEGAFVNVAWFGAFPDNTAMCNTTRKCRAINVIFGQTRQLFKKKYFTGATWRYSVTFCHILNSSPL